MGKLVNRAKMTVASAPGTGAISLGSAVSGYQTFAAAGVNNGDVVSYVVEDGTNWEVGQGTYASSGLILTRTTIVASSSSGSAITASSSALVYVSALASDLATVPPGYFRNLKIAPGATVNSQISVTADSACLGYSSYGGLVVSSVSLTISTGSSGANGLDTGSIAASTWYALWIISNGTTTAGLLSLSSTSPTLPSGYYYASRFGWARTDGSSHLVPIIQAGKKARYIINGSTYWPVVVNGTLGSIITPTYVAVAVSSFLPPTAATGVFDALATSNSNTGVMLAPNGNFGPYNTNLNALPPIPPMFFTGPTGGSSSNPVEILLESTSVYVASQSSGLIVCLGWEDNL